MRDACHPLCGGHVFPESGTPSRDWYLGGHGRGWRPIGLFVGGWAVQYVDWQAVFLINVPIAAVCLVLSVLVVPESRDEQRTPLDPVGGMLSLAGLGVMLYTIIEAPLHGWTSSSTLVEPWPPPPSSWRSGHGSVSGNTPCCPCLSSVSQVS